MAAGHPIPARRRFQDLTGRVFGRLTVVSYAGPRAGHQFWNCRCECGRKTVVRGNNLLTRRNVGCGCLRDGHPTHGRSRTPEWTAWQGMRQRCHNPNSTEYRRYGGRGIYVCDRWRQSFAAFLADMGPKPSPSHSVDRIDNDGPYSPDNCRWATVEQQHANKRNTRLLTVKGQTLMASEWARRYDLSTSTLNARLQRGWSDDRAVTTPVRRFR